MYKRILVPIDASPTSQRALDEAARYAAVHGARLRLMHVVDHSSYANGFETPAAYTADVLPYMRETGQTLLEHARESLAARGLTAETQLVDGSLCRVGDCVVDEARAWGADLIVMGTHGRRGLDRLFLGSDAEQVARTAPVPVLLLRAAG